MTKTARTTQPLKRDAMKLKKDIAVSETGFIFNPATGDSFSSNSVGLEIISLLKTGKTQKEIIKTITAKYNIKSLEFEKDYDDFISQLNGFNLAEKLRK